MYQVKMSFLKWSAPPSTSWNALPESHKMYCKSCGNRIERGKFNWLVLKRLSSRVTPLHEAWCCSEECSEVYILANI